MCSFYFCPQRERPQAEISQEVQSAGSPSQGATLLPLGPKPLYHFAHLFQPSCPAASALSS